ncbi:RILP-like protein 1 [Cricetulus griseus]|nr:RILP-like protein 1 [Cricetulus griseus]
MDRIEKERKHQKELELVEDVWRGEAQDLLSQIAQLQEENKQLMTNLNHKDVGFSEEEFQKQEGCVWWIKTRVYLLTRPLWASAAQFEKDKEIQLQADGEECLSDSEKAALDLKDPNRPRFTLQELRDVLHERNELKSKVFLLQEELAYYKSEEIEEENRIPQPPPIIHPRTSPQPESGIKRLFSFFSRDKKRLTNTQRPTHIHESFGQWANTHRDDGYTEQGQEALQHL